MVTGWSYIPIWGYNWHKSVMVFSVFPQDQ